MAQVLELIVFAALAGVVLFQLYSVLGRRSDDDSVAREQEKRPQPVPTVEPIRTETPKVGDLSGVGVAAVKAADPGFEAPDFLSGARGAYELIVTAFARGDKKALRPLLSDEMFAEFEADIDARADAGELGPIEVINTPRAEIDNAEVIDRLARVQVRFVAQIRPTDSDEEAEETEELWTFERNVDAKDPNWTLVETTEAEA